MDTHPGSKSHACFKLRSRHSWILNLREAIHVRSETEKIVLMLHLLAYKFGGGIRLTSKIRYPLGLSAMELTP